ncbi:hypothetical protein TNIN_80471, partial [Trichonephila inaurata madagascariensis]
KAKNSKIINSLTFLEAKRQLALIEELSWQRATEALEDLANDETRMSILVFVQMYEASSSRRAKKKLNKLEQLWSHHAALAIQEMLEFCHSTK